VSEHDGFRVERDAERGVATITLDVPGKLNRLPLAARDQLAHLFAELGADAAVRFVVLTGEGEAFTAGGDIAAFLEASPEHLSRLAWNVAAPERCPKPVIAKLRGYCLGVGLELALACDFRVAADDAQLGLPEVGLGMIPGSGGTQRLARLIGEQMQKIAAARSRAADDRAALRAIAATQNVAAGKPVPPPPPPFDVAKFAGIFAAIGLAIGAIGTMLAAVLTGILKLAWWQIPILIAVVILAISLPSVLLAWLKLRKRNLGPILDANGWAVNARAKINIPFGTSLTSAARLPENAERSLVDPFAERKRPWKLYLALAALLAAALVLWGRGYFTRWFGGS